MQSSLGDIETMTKTQYVKKNEDPGKKFKRKFLYFEFGLRIEDQMKNLYDSKEMDF